MNEIAGNDRPEHREPRRRGAPARGRRASRAVVFAVEGLLAFAALYAGPAVAEPAVRQVTSSGLAQTPVPALKREYLRCDRASSQQRLTLEVAVHCSAVGDELLKREFDGDLDLLLAWWRGAQNAPE